MHTQNNYGLNCNQMSELELQISDIENIYKSNQILNELTHIRKYKNQSRTQLHVNKPILIIQIPIVIINISSYKY